MRGNSVRGMAAVQLEEDGLWGYIDTDGKIVIPPRFDLDFQDAFFVNGVAAVDENDRSVLINSKGLVISDFGDAQLSADYGELLKIYWQNGWGYMNRSGRLYGATGTKSNVF